NADDFGLTKGITDGIITSHKNGVVYSTTLMMNGLAVDYALQEIKKCPTLNVGIHLVLTWGKPLRNDLPSLVHGSCYFKFTSTLDEVPTVKVVEREWKGQIEAIIKKVVRLTFKE